MEESYYLKDVKQSQDRHVCLLSCFSHVWLFETQWTTSLVRGILHARVLEWVAISSSGGSSWPRDQTQVSYVSCSGRWVLYHECHLGSPRVAQTLLEQVEASLSQPSQHWKNILRVEQMLTLYSNWCSSWCLHSSKWPDPQRKAPTESTSLGPKGSPPRVGQHGTPLQYSWLENPMDGGAW